LEGEPFRGFRLFKQRQQLVSRTGFDNNASHFVGRSVVAAN
jgi:hypothetical protein